MPEKRRKLMEADGSLGALLCHEGEWRCREDPVLGSSQENRFLTFLVLATSIRKLAPALKITKPKIQPLKIGKKRA